MEPSWGGRRFQGTVLTLKTISTLVKEIKVFLLISEKTARNPH